MSLPDGFVQPGGVLALDVHGVVLNNPLPRFVAEIGARTGAGVEPTLTTWRRELRIPFWTGTIDDDEMWAQLAPGLDPFALRNELEDRYEPGPLFDVVQERRAMREPCTMRRGSCRTIVTTGWSNASAGSGSSPVSTRS